MRQSAGLLPFRRNETGLEFFLVHPGGPFWRNKDLGAWSVAKGEYGSDEDPLSAAQREFREETGISVSGNFIELGVIKQKAGKLVIAWAVETSFDTTGFTSNQITTRWPPKSGRLITFPEIDQYGWFGWDDAIVKINAAQIAFLERLNKIFDDNKQ